MNNSGIVSVVVSYVKLFNGPGFAESAGPNQVERLIKTVAASKDLETVRIEVVTEKEHHINYSGTIYAPLPKIDEIVPIEVYEASICSLAKEGDFKRYASVRLSVEYPIAEYEAFVTDARDQGNEDSNLFNWIEYCTADALEIIREDLQDDDYLPTALTVRGA